MHITHFEAVCASVSIATIRCHSWGGGGVGPKMNMFEQVSSDHDQMSLAVGGRSPGLMSRGGRYPGLMSRGYPTT